uniref:Protein TsetseEP domain-containing protein n=1 Tax=Anopheles culicifacies TaxID=139723 RepID=A0A182MLV9_9DIPT
MANGLIAFVFTLICVIQNVTGRPDFGLNGDIVGSSIALDTSGGVSLIIGTLSDYRIQLGSQYQVLYNMQDAFYSVADKFTTAGIAMTDKLSLLVDDKTGIVTPPFQSTISTISGLQGVISTGYTQEFLTLKPRDKPFITDRLTDSLNYISQTLTTLDEILRKLQTAAELAQTQAGGDGKSVPKEFARSFVTPRMVNSLLNTIVRIAGAIAPLIYSVHEPLAQLDRGDTYITTAKSDIEAALLRAHQEVVNFNGNMRELKQNTNAVVATVGPAYNEQQTLVGDILPNLQASPKYPFELKNALERFEDAMSVESIEEKTSLVDITIEEYLDQSRTYDDDLVTVYGDRLCPAIQSVVQVLIASGPYSNYCFKKYSQRVVDIAVHNFYDIGECYALELNRLYSVNRLISNIIGLVTVNFSELYDNLNTCASILPCPGDCDSCIETLGEFVDVLARLMEEKFDLLLQIVPYEAKASLQRVKSCAAFSKYKLIADVHDLLKAVFKCEETGYKQTP